MKAPEKAKKLANVIKIEKSDSAYLIEDNDL